MEHIQKMLKEQLNNYRELLALSSELFEKLSNDQSQEAEPVLLKRGEVINKVEAIEEKIVKSGAVIPDGSETYEEIGKVLEEIAVIDSKSEQFLKEGKEGVIKSLKGLQKGKNAAKGYGSGRGKQQGGSGKFISIKE